ncbi:hypothetical protein [Mycetocola zhujimingii]|uniref:hypothetical protein n=1 Tax=Mycetocola zhujimingii TaxID=2079792 RepID=UPI000D39B018|nr:hypothetical protein [Mycetocola zhujimingii]AWB86566.1 hypothetical protein C3E77_08015 [Mycetocola zhujimingii]
MFVSPIRISPQEIAVTLEAGGYLIEWADDRRIAANVEDQDDFERLIGILIPDIAPPGLSVGAR